MSIPWAAILSIIIKITMWVLDRNEETKESKRKFYEFVDHMDSYIPLKLKDDARRQMEIIREEQRLKEIKLEQDKKMLHNYKSAYEANHEEPNRRDD
jgi:hypothetical protein